MHHKSALAWLVPILATACGSDPQPLASSNDPNPAAACSGLPCDDGRVNAIDRVVRPLLSASGRSLALADATTLCRRLSIDLTGLAPSEVEVAQRCSGRTPAQMVRYFMDKPMAVHVPASQIPYVYVNRRAWSELFSYYVVDYNTTTTFYADVLYLDGLVAKLYKGDISYDEFVVEALAAPAFMRRFGLFNTQPDLTQIAAAAFHIFLGREALPSEAADFGNLWRPFSLQLVNFTDAKRRYPDCLTCTHYDVVLRGGSCSGGEALLCQSTVLGPARITPSLPVGTNTVLYDLTGADAQEIRKPGRLIVARREFAEAAVDRVLSKYLGWWNAGTYRPDYNLPAVRDALVDFFIAHRYRIRDLEAEVLTSLLYTQPQVLRDGDIAQAPLWAYGPTKQVQAEVFLDSLAAAAGVDMGGCDFRFSAASNDPKGTPFDPRNRIAAAYTYPVSAGYDANYYLTTARKLGGCPGSSERGDTGGLVIALAKREVLTRLCTNAVALANLVPLLGAQTQVGDGLPQLLSQQLRLAFGRPATSDENQALLSAAGTDACKGPSCDWKTVGGQLCMSLFASSLFNFY